MSDADLYFQIQDCDCLTEIEKSVIRCISYFQRTTAQTAVLCNMSEKRVGTILRKSKEKLVNNLNT